MNLEQYLYACNIAFYMASKQKPINKEEFISSWTRSKLEELDNSAGEFAVRLLAHEGQVDNFSRSVVVKEFNDAAEQIAGIQNGIGQEYVKRNQPLRFKLDNEIRHDRRYS